MRPRSRILPALRIAALLVLSYCVPGPAFAQNMDCDDLYFGIHHPPDYPKALRCFESHQDWEFQILLLLNGEGTPQDARKAAELARAWPVADPGQAHSVELAALQKAIDQRLEHPKDPYPRIDYCKEIAGDTIAGNHCGAVEDEIADVRFDAKVAATRARLPTDAAAVFDRVVAAFAAFKEAEGHRMLEQYRGGTIRIMAGLGQGAFVREQFLALIEQTLDQHHLEVADAQAYKTADDELNQLYREKIRGATPYYRQVAKEAQVHWIEVRDGMAKLARALYPDSKLDPALSMKTAITKVRVRELRYDPVCPKGC
jgi:uncharacterized protein YecT (DUF1311 family)